MFDVIGCFSNAFGRDLVISLVLVVEVSVISLLLLVLISDGLLYPFPHHALIEVFHLLKVLILGSSLLDRSSL